MNYKYNKMHIFFISECIFFFTFILFIYFLLFILFFLSFAFLSKLILVISIWCFFIPQLYDI